MTTIAEPTTSAALSQAAAGTTASATHFVGRRYLQLVLVLGALSAIGPLTIDTYLPALPRLSADLGASDSQAQLTITGLIVGMGLGQLVIGPLSDALGRRKPLLVGLALHGAMSVLCALAPSITLLALTRTLQGVGGAAVAVVSMAIVRDLFSGVKAAQLLSRLMLVVGVAPVLAPSLGSALLTLTSWRGIFVVLAVAAVALLVLALVALPETLPTVRRSRASLGGSLRAYRGLFGDRLFVVMVLVSGFSFATLFAYISGAPFLLQELYGLTPQQFGLAFSVNAFGLILMTQLNPVLIRRVSPVRVLMVAVAVSTVASAALVATALTGFGGLLGFLVPLWFVVASAGLSFPNAPAIALNRHGESAGSAAALLGSAQFVLGGMIAPLVGALADGTAVPMAAVLLGTSAVGLALLLTSRRSLTSVSYE
ncbi:multidrug effflux MFS transporter [uncultured Friedmanniella sp.]|uniref:multidrug effflux MFS transporter n=1 Tax=uncultured Friedmanniella sp. TaxID=335381 RepID=UPI0035CC4049